MEFSNTLILPTLSKLCSPHTSNLDRSAFVISIFRKSSTSSLSVLELLDSRFANFHSLNLRSGTFAPRFYLVNQVLAWAAKSLNNYFPLQRKWWILFFFPLSTPFSFDIEEMSSPSRINFSSAPERHEFTQVSRVIFPCQTSSQKGTPYQARRPSDDRFIICTRRECIPVTYRRK